MKDKKQIIAIFIGIFIGLSIFVIFQIISVAKIREQSKFVPHEISTILYPPKNAITANIFNITDNVKKQGRLDDTYKSILNKADFFQGESLVTEKNGSSDISFDKILNTTIFSDSQLDYVNGLSQSFVLRQPKGKVSYAVYDTNGLISIRSLALLTQLSKNTNATIITDTDKQTVTVIINNGMAKIAFSDSKYNTIVKNIKTGEKVIFDNKKQTLE